MSGEVSSFNITIYRGARRTLVFTITDATGAIIPVGGWVAKLVLRKSEAYPTVAASYDGVVEGDGSTGKIDVALAPTDTLALLAGEYKAGFFRTNVGDEDMLGEGTITVANSIYKGATELT